MRKTVDLHTHSSFSDDGRDSIELLCENAVKNGVGHLAVTDHVDYKKGSADIDVRFDQYFEEIENMRLKYQGRLHILSGVEIGQVHYWPDAARELVRRYDFDVVIGSVHEVDAGFISRMEYGSMQQCDAMFHAYFDCLLKLLDFGCFDVLAHIDFPLRKLQRWFPDASLRRYEAQVKTVLKRTAELHKTLEVNTQGLRRWQQKPCPEPWILSLYKEYGGVNVSIGTDAHVAGDVGFGYGTAVELLKRCGFEQTVLFDRRQVSYLKL